MARTLRYTGDVEPGGYNQWDLYKARLGPFSDYAQVNDPDEYYRNVMDVDPVDVSHMGALDYEGPIGETGRYPDQGGHIEYQEPYPHMFSYRGRQSEADVERYPFLKERVEDNPLLQKALIKQKRASLYGDEEIADVPIKSPILAEEEITDVENLVNPDFNLEWLEKEYPTDLPYDELDDLEAQNVTPTFLTSEEQEEYLERVRNMPTIQDEGIPAADKWRNFLSKVTRQPYRPAMGGVTMGSGKTYSPAQLNKMNALGGWYSEPSRAARRTQKRVANMLARRSEGKPIGTTNLGQFTGRDEGRGSYTATTAPAPAGVTTSSGMHGGRHYMRGGRVGYNKGGRVGILSIL